MKLFWAVMHDGAYAHASDACARAENEMLSLPCRQLIKFQGNKGTFLQATLSPRPDSVERREFGVGSRGIMVAGGRLHFNGMGSSDEAAVQLSEVYCDSYFQPLLDNVDEVFRGDARVEGEIAGAFWNQTEGIALIIRDCIGTVPVYYFSGSNSLVVSNHLGCILASLGRAPEMCAERLIDWIQGFSGRNQLTAYKGLYRLPAGHQMTWRPGSEMEIQRYYELAKHIAVVGGDFEQNSAKFRRLLFQAVKRRIEPKGNVAVELSGGLDSSSVTALLHRLSGSRLISFSAVYPEQSVSDESDYIKALVKDHGVANISFEGAALDIAASFSESLYEFKDFHFAGNIHIAREVQKRAVEYGCVQIFNGIDGDNVASHGLYLLVELAQSGQWLQFGRHIGGISDLFSSHVTDPEVWLFNCFGRDAFQSKCRNRIPFSAFWGAVAVALTTSIKFRWLFGQLRLARQRGSALTRSRLDWMGTFSRSFFRTKFLENTSFESTVRNSIETSKPESEQEAQLRMLSHGVNEHYFELIHALSAERGIATMCPFMDRDLIEFCLGVPTNQKLRAGWNRAFLRTGMAKDLPSAIVARRSKSNLGPSLFPVIRKVCIERLKQLLEAERCPLWEVFEPDRVRELIGQAEAGENQSSLSKVWMIWAVFKATEMVKLGRRGRPVS